MLGVFTAALTLTIGFVLGLINTITSFLAGLSGAILQWVTSGNFITLSYTNAGVLPGDPRFNEFVAMGWELTRGLTNIIFVIAMVAIGLGTALGRNEYQAKKALPILIIIALLINFTPVLLGLVIDASNIVMNYFLNAVGGFGFFSNNMKAMGELAFGSLGKFFDPATQANLVIGLLMMIAFSLLSAVIFFLFSLLFIGRYIALWLLVILSPFALACYILPATKKYYTQWLEQLTQWCIIGITGGFFLYLASKMIEISSKVSASPMKGPLGLNLDQNNPLAFFFGGSSQIANQILPWGISIAVMIIGFTMSLTTGAMGGKMVVNWGKKLPANFAKTRIGGKLMGGAASLTQKGLGGIAPQLERLKKIPGIGKGLNLAAKPLSWAAKGANKALGPGLTEYAATKRKVSTPKGWEQMSIPEKENYINAQIFASDKTVLASKMKNEGTFKHATKKFKDAMMEIANKMEKNAIYGKEARDIQDAMPNEITFKAKLDAKINQKDKNAFEAEVDEFIKTIDPGLTAGLSAEETRDLAAQATYISKMKAGDMKGVNKESMDSLAFRIGSQNFTSGHFQQIEQEFGRDGLEKVITGAGGVGKLTADEFYEKNPGLFKSFMTNPALSHVSIEARGQMTDPNDQKTTNFDAFEKRMDMLQIIEKSPPSERAALGGALALAKKIKVAETKTQQIFKENPELEQWNEWDRSQLELKDFGKKRRELWGKMMTAAKAGRHTESAPLNRQIKEIDKKRRETGEKMRELKNQFKKTPALETLRNEIKKYEDEIKLGSEEFKRFKKTEIDSSTTLKSSWDKIEKLQNIRI